MSDYWKRDFLARRDFFFLVSRLLSKLTADNHSPLIGSAADGFPIYGTATAILRTPTRLLKTHIKVPTKEEPVARRQVRWFS